MILPTLLIFGFSLGIYFLLGLVFYVGVESRQPQMKLTHMEAWILIVLWIPALLFLLWREIRNRIRKSYGL